MKSILILLCLLMIVPFTFAQTEIVQYQFEEGSGGIVLDTSGFNNHGTVIGATWDGTNPKWGLYAIEFDGNNDYINTIGNIENVPDKFAMSFWVKPDADIDLGTFWTVQETVNNTEVLTMDYHFGTQEFRLLYTNNSFQLNSLVIDTNLTEDGNTWHHIVLNVDDINDEIQVFVDGVFKTNTTVQIDFPDSPNKILRLGADLALVNEYNGEMDAVRAFQGLLSQAQVVELLTTNAVTLEDDVTPEPELNITGFAIADIINTYAPINGSNSTNPVQFTATLNIQASCDLYIDNQFIQEYNNVLAFTDNFNLNEGFHDYFLYCYYDDSNTLYYEQSNVTTFEVIPGSPGTITFTLIGSDFTAGTTPLYLTSPCLDKGVVIPTVTKPYNSLANPQGAYFKEFNSGGISSMVLPSGAHEFCIFHGLIDFGTFNKTVEYNIDQYFGNIDIGSYNIPNNLTTSYTIVLDTFDIYGKTNPKAWGTTWTGIILGLIGFFIGLAILAFGITEREPKLIIVGGILTLVTLGYQVSGILGVLLL